MEKKELEEIKNNIKRVDRNGTTHILINYQDWDEIIEELEKHIKE